MPLLHGDTIHCYTGVKWLCHTLSPLDRSSSTNK